MNNENIVSVILHDKEKFIVGDNYRFCLVLLQRNESKSMLIVGCSKITKLKTLESTVDASDGGHKLTHFSDISHLDETTDEENDNQKVVDAEKDAEASTIVSNPLVKSANRLTESNVLDNFSEFAITGLCIGILFTIIFAIFWITPLVKSERRSSPATICYAADDHIAAIENTNRYLKLQATTTL